MLALTLICNSHLGSQPQNPALVHKGVAIVITGIERENAVFSVIATKHRKEGWDLIRLRLRLEPPQPGTRLALRGSEIEITDSDNKKHHPASKGELIPTGASQGTVTYMASDKRWELTIVFEHGTPAPLDLEFLLPRGVHPRTFRIGKGLVDVSQLEATR